MTTKIKSKHNDILKLIAIITMFIDHCGAILFPKAIFLRIIGRISFPIFAYMLAMGFIHTSNRKKYGVRLFLFALISQPAFMVFTLSYHHKINPITLNVMFLLFLGLIYLQVFESMNNCFTNAKDYFSISEITTGIKNVILGVVLLITFIIITFLPICCEILFTNIRFEFLSNLNPEYFRMCDFKFSYGTYGLLVMLSFYLFNERPFLTLLGFIFATLADNLIDLAKYSTHLPSHTPAYKKITFFFKELVSLEMHGNHFPQINKVDCIVQNFFKFRYTFFQNLSIMGLSVVLTLQNVKSSFRMNKWIAYIFYPTHLVILYLVKLYILPLFA